MPVAIFLVDRSCHVVWANLSARLLVGDGIALCDGRLVATAAEKRDALASLLRRALDAGDVEAQQHPGAIMIPRSPGSTPLVAVVRPLEAPAHAESAARAVVYVSDPDRGLRASRERLRQLFGLTRSEAELVARLASGYGVRETAAQLGITQETARSHVKRAFLKTGVRRQAELVRLALATATAGALDA
jgi:DNA-binding CsgD family transcriptional regulator